MSKLICIDPGHGGYDPGAVGGCEEKDFTLTVGMELKKILEARGITVVMTRESDTSPKGLTNLNDELQARCDISDAANADLFLSIHANAGGGTGAEAYVWPGGNAAVIATDLVNSLAPTMGVHGEAVKDGGPNGRHLYVVCNPKAPTVLLEIGFLDSSDFPKLAENLHRFADILAVPLSKFLGGVAPVVTPATLAVALDAHSVDTAQAVAVALDAHSAATEAKVASALADLQAHFDKQIQAVITSLKG